MGYKRKAINGAVWTGALRGSTRLVSFLKNLIIARLLTPNEFGAFGIALLVTVFLEILTNTGINTFLIQEDEEEIDQYVDTAWMVSIFRGVLIALLILGAAKWVSIFFRTKEAYGLLVFIALVPFLRGFINPAAIKIQKALNFRLEFGFRLSTFLLDAVVAVFVTFWTGSVYGLIWGMLAGVVLEIILSFVLVGPRPRLAFERDRLREIVARGKWIVSADILQYAFSEGDDVLVGRLINSYSLGLYQMAYRLATLPITEVGEMVGKVALPVYTRIAKENDRLWRAYWLTTAATIALVLPFGIVLFAFSRELVALLLGQQWIGAAEVLKVIVVYAMARAVALPSFSVFYALKKQEYVAYTTAVATIGMLGSIVPLIFKFGMVGAGMSTIVGLLVSLPVNSYFLVKVFK